MGACQSCLGQRDKDIVDESEDSRLLYEDGNGMQYGSFSEAALQGDDAVEAQRENEALQRVVAKTSSNMVDVFDIAPQPSDSQGSRLFAQATHGARAARYQHLVAKLNTSHNDQLTGIKVDWLADGADGSLGKSDRPVSLKTLDDADDALVGTFADAAAAAMQ